MNPTTKTMLIAVGSISAIFIVPALIIVLRDYLNIIIFIPLFIYCFGIVGYYLYHDLLPIIKQKQLEEDEIMRRFEGNPEKIHFYKGFKKYFDGELNAKELEKWLINHPVKH